MSAFVFFWTACLTYFIYYYYGSSSDSETSPNRRGRRGCPRSVGNQQPDRDSSSDRSDHSDCARHQKTQSQQEEEEAGRETVGWKRPETGWYWVTDPG